MRDRDGRLLRYHERGWLGRLTGACRAAGLATQLREEKTLPVVLRVQVPFPDGTRSTVGESVMVKPGPGSEEGRPVWWYQGTELLAPCGHEACAVDALAMWLTPA